MSRGFNLNIGVDLPAGASFSTLVIDNLSGVLGATAGLVIGSRTTTDLPEGTNLYYTDVRARAALSATLPIVYNGTSGQIGITTSLIPHNGLTGLQGGTSGQYYHLDLAQYTALALSGTFTPGSVLFAGTSGVVSQDNANFFYDSSNSRLGIGTSNPQLQSAGFKGINIVGDGTATEYRFTAYRSSSPRALIKGQAAAGTLASPSALSSGGAGIFRIDADAYNGASFTRSVELELQTGTGTIGLSSTPGRFIISVTPDGTVATTERIRFDSANITVNEGGEDYDFRVESDTNTHCLFVDAGNSRVGINNSAPGAPLDVTGNARISGLTTLGDDATTAESECEILDVDGDSYITISNNSDTFYSGLYFKRARSGSSETGGAAIRLRSDTSSANARLEFCVLSSMAFTNTFSAVGFMAASTNSAQVGVGVQPDPLATLHVTPGVRSSTTGTVTVTNGSTSVPTSADLTAFFSVNDAIRIFSTSTDDYIFTVSAITAVEITIDSAWLGSNSSAATAFRVSASANVFRVDNGDSNERFTIDRTGSMTWNRNNVTGLFCRFESASNANFVYFDGTNSRVGINNGTPALALDITGSASVSSTMMVGIAGASTVFGTLNVEGGSVYQGQGGSDLAANELMGLYGFYSTDSSAGARIVSGGIAQYAEQNWTGTTTTWDARLEFQTVRDGSVFSSMYLNSNGYIGMGLSPSYAIDAIGPLFVDGATNSIIFYAGNSLSMSGTDAYAFQIAGTGTRQHTIQGGSSGDYTLLLNNTLSGAYHLTLTDGNLTVTAGNITATAGNVTVGGQVYVDSDNAYVIIDRGATNRRGALRFQTAATDTWALGLPDSDESSFSTRFFIGQSVGGSSTALEIDTSNNTFLKEGLSYKEFKATNGLTIYEDWTSTTYTGKNNWAYTQVESTGSVSLSTALIDQSHSGIVTLETGTGLDSDVEEVTLYLGSLSQMMRLGGGAVRFEWDIYLDDLSTAGNEYEVYVGLGSNIASLGTFTDFTNGVYFKYRRATSVNWIIVTADNSTRTSTTTSTAVASATWTRLTAEINAAGSSVTFYVNGTSVGTHTTNIPTAAGRTLAPNMTILKTAGTSTSRKINADYFTMGQLLTTAR